MRIGVLAEIEKSHFGNMVISSSGVPTAHESVGSKSNAPVAGSDIGIKSEHSQESAGPISIRIEFSHVIVEPPESGGGGCSAETRQEPSLHKKGRSAGHPSAVRHSPVSLSRDVPSEHGASCRPTSFVCGAEPSLQVRGVVNESVAESQYKKIIPSAPEGNRKSAANEDVRLVSRMELLVPVSRIFSAQSDSFPPSKHKIPSSGPAHVVVTFHVRSVSDPPILGTIPI